MAANRTEGFILDILRRVTPECSIELWDILRENLSAKCILTKGVPPALYNGAVADIIGPCLERNAVKKSAYPDFDVLRELSLKIDDVNVQFSALIWPTVRERCVRMNSKDPGTLTLSPQGEYFLAAFADMMRSTMEITCFEATTLVAAHAEFFFDALRDSKTIGTLILPQDSLLERSDVFLKELLLSPPRLGTVRSPFVQENILDAIAERQRRINDGRLPNTYNEILRYEVSDYRFTAVLRFVRFLKRTNIPLELYLLEPASPSQKVFVDEQLRGKFRFTAMDVDWIIDQYETNKKRRLDIALCPRCGEYDPSGSHFVVYRYLTGAGGAMFRCDVENIKKTLERKRKRKEMNRQQKPAATNRSPTNAATSPDDSWSVTRCI